MQINKETMTLELDKLVGTIFALPEIVYVKVRDVIIENNSDRCEKIQEAIAQSYHDCYSDIDLSVLVRLNPKDAITPAAYMERIDRFGISTGNCLGLMFVNENNMYRIILKNGMRYDFGFDFEFDNSADFIYMLPKEEEYNNPNWPIDNVNRFWFVQIQALGKLYRNDFLIGDHLANLNINETLVQQMVLRDMKYGTNHHRYGYEEELAYWENRHKCPIKTENEGFRMIADKLYCAALTYDSLTKAFYPEYEARSSVFFDIWKAYEECRG
ncbi:MAG: hypothetical protein J6K48_03370 [Lachnospiraceae bacterium]|nr:hypothetical protein [Lachnospiraceae bacterium]